MRTKLIKNINITAKRDYKMILRQNELTKLYEHATPEQSVKFILLALRLVPTVGVVQTSRGQQEWLRKSKPTPEQMHQDVNSPST